MWPSGAARVIGSTMMLTCTPNGRIFVNDYNGVQRAVLSGSGIGEVPSIVCGKHLTAGQLVEVMPNWRFEPVTISAVYSARLNLSRVVRLFKDFCVENIEMLVPDAKL